MWLMYDILFFFGFLIYFPVMVLRGKAHRDMWMRLGFFTNGWRKELEGPNNIWIHAVSVGEVLVILDLIEKIKKTFPGHRIILSTVTITGNILAIGKLKKEDAVVFAPLDFSWAVRNYIRVIKPRLYISTETELWPNLFHFLEENQVPVIVINGRISDRSFRNYQKVSFLARQVLHNVNTFCMQSQLDADRVIKLGADPGRVRVVGNIKFDSSPGLAPLRRGDLGLNAQDLIFIAGSTHPGEEIIMLDVYSKLIQQFPYLRLIVAPRHVERSAEVIGLIEQRGLKVQKMSALAKEKKGEGAVVVVDTIGQLRSLYSLADIVFVGKSLAAHGGQNMIEPAALGKAVFVGPHTENFKDVMSIFLRDQAVIQVNNAQELYERMADILKNPEKAKILGIAAQNAVQKYQGATQKTFEEIKQVLHLPAGRQAPGV